MISSPSITVVMLMRHVLLDVAFSRPPPPLSGGMPDGTSVACMIACAGTPAGVMPAKRGTCPRTVDLSPIAATADMHLLTAVRAHVQSVRFDGLHGAAHPGKHWTTPCREGIKARRPCPCGTRRKKKARGSAKKWKDAEKKIQELVSELFGTHA